MVSKQGRAVQPAYLNAVPDRGVAAAATKALSGQTERRLPAGLQDTDGPSRSMLPGEPPLHFPNGRDAQKSASTYMGHANISITLDRYGPLMPGSEDEAAGLLDTYLAAQQERADAGVREAEPSARPRDRQPRQASAEPRWSWENSLTTAPGVTPSSFAVLKMSC
jgi:hypothetical protein